MGRPLGAKDKKPRATRGSCVRIKMTCIECGKEFILRREVKDHSGLCSKCQQAVRMAAFRKRHPGYDQEPVRRIQRREWSLMHKYKVTMEEYEARLKRQKGVCAICEGPQREGHSFCVDHDHETGVVRGLLCHKCNQAIGLLNDRATKAAQYLLSNSRLSWDDYFMSVAVLASSRSKDRSMKVGAVIVRDRVVISTGYNGFPRGIDDDKEERHQRPLKYLFTCHAEENAIYNAARIGAKVSGSDIYVTLHPCSGCAKAIIQSQVRRVVVLNTTHDNWEEEFRVSGELLSEAGIEVVVLDPKI